MSPGRYLILGAGLLASVIADGVSFTEWPANLTPGQSVTLKWAGGTDAPTTITLRKGPSTDLQDVQVLTNDASNGEFSWTPPADLQNSNDYAFQINQGDDVNYTDLLPLTGGTDAPTPDDKTQEDMVDASGTASATDASATGAAPTSSGSESASTTEGAASATSAASDAAATSGTASAQNNAGSSTTATQSHTETASPSKMNTPYVGNKKPSSTASALESTQTDAAGRAAIAPLLAIAGFVSFLLLIQ